MPSVPIPPTAGVTDIGARIRRARRDRGLSQGDMEQRTGLLRCYLSRVENGHTAPSLQTLARLAAALEMPLVGFFDQALADAPADPALPTAEAANFLAQMRPWAERLSDRDRQQVLALAQQMAAGQPATPAESASHSESEPDALTSGASAGR